MNIYYIFALILMAVFSTANAIPHQLQKRITHFEKCDFIEFPATPLSVTLNPDPVVPGKLITFDVSGTLDQVITQETTLRAYYYDPVTNQTVGDGYFGTICTGTGCPI